MIKILLSFFSKKVTISKWQFNLFGSVCIFIGTILGSFFTLKGIYKAFASTNASLTLNTDTDFLFGTTLSTSVTGTGTSASIALAGSTGPDGTIYRKPITITNSSGTTLSDYQILLDEGEVGYWKFDESSGISTYDSSGNQVTGTAYGTNVIDGKYNKSRSFNGSNDYIDISSVTNSITLNHTLCSWIKTTTNSLEMVVTTGNSEDTLGAYMAIDSDGFAILGGNSGSGWNSFGSSKKVNDGQWHYICGIFDGGTNGTIYIDGDHDNSHILNYAIPHGMPTIIGRYQTRTIQYFSGSIDELRIYSRDLSSQDITTLYQSNLSPLLGQIYSR